MTWTQPFTQSLLLPFAALMVYESIPFAWKPDTWYRLKLRVENLANGSVRTQGKAWPVGEAEPAAWTIEKVEPNGNREGAPGLFIDAQFGAMLDNFKLTPN